MRHTRQTGERVPALWGHASECGGCKLAPVIGDIGKLSDDKRAYLFSLIDICLRDFKTRRAYAKLA